MCFLCRVCTDTPVGWVLLYVHRNRRLIRDGSPGRSPRLSHSSWSLGIPPAVKPLSLIETWWFLFGREEGAGWGVGVTTNAQLTVLTDGLRVCVHLWHNHWISDCVPVYLYHYNMAVCEREWEHEISNSQLFYKADCGPQFKFSQNLCKLGLAKPLMNTNMYI